MTTTENHTPKTVLLLPDRDHKPGDWRGAFRPEADRFAALYSEAAVVQVDISKGDAGRRVQVLDAVTTVAQAGPLDLVAFCCHGWGAGPEQRPGIQLGFHLEQLPELAAALGTAAGPDLSVVLYACSTAADDISGSAGTAGPGGFAEQLHQAISRCVSTSGRTVRCRVDAHDRKGHCCSNAFVVRCDDTGTDWLIAPGSPHWAAWERELSDRHHSTLRFRYPLMSREEIEGELQREYVGT